MVKKKFSLLFWCICICNSVLSNGIIKYIVENCINVIDFEYFLERRIN